MESISAVAASGMRKAGYVALSAVVALALTVSPASRSAAYAQEPTDLVAAQSLEGSQAGVSLASSSKSAIKKTVKKNAKAIVKSARAGKITKKSSTKAKLASLKKVYTHIATDESFGGTYSFPSNGYLYFYLKATSAANKSYYPLSQPTNMKSFYKKYAIDSYKTKQASCHHYAALFAVAAKQLLGSYGTVKIGTRNVLTTGADGLSTRDVHSWVEVKLGKTTYIYDTQKGNSYSKEAGAKASFGKYCGSKKSSVKSLYNNYKKAKYCTVTL